MVNMKNDVELSILQAAREHFVTNGYAGTRMQEIADAAGINKAMLHYYFRSKEKLYWEVVNQIMRDVMPKFSMTLQQEGTFWERVSRLVDVYISTLIEQPDIPFFIMYELSQKRERFLKEFRSTAAYVPGIKTFMVQMQEEMQAGNIPHMSPVQLMLSIVGMTVFPFVAKPVFTQVINISEEDFVRTMEERKIFIIDFLKKALTKV